MKPLDTPEALALFLAGIGYERDDVVAAVVDDFKLTRDRANAIVDEAFAKAAQQQQELDRAVERDEAAARAAEHDVSTTMHQEGEWEPQPRPRA